MIRLKVSPEMARSRLFLIEHETFASAVRDHWRVNADGAVPAQTVCWLFCWAETGMGSENAAAAAKRVFKEIFNVPYGVFRAHVPHEWAQWARYAEGDIEAELEDKLVGWHGT